MRTPSERIAEAILLRDELVGYLHDNRHRGEFFAWKADTIRRIDIWLHDYQRLLIPALLDVPHARENSPASPSPSAVEALKNLRPSCPQETEPGA